MCPVRLHLIHIFLGHCPFLGPETSLRKDSVLGMAMVSPSSRLFLQPRRHPTVPPTVHWVQLLLSMLGDLSVCKAGIFFSFSGTWESGQSPSVKQLEWPAWRLFHFPAWKSLSHLFYTLDHMFNAHKRLLTLSGSGTVCYLQPGDFRLSAVLSLNWEPSPTRLDPIPLMLPATELSSDSFKETVYTVSC